MKCPDIRNLSARCLINSFQEFPSFPLFYSFLISFRLTLIYVYFSHYPPFFNFQPFLFQYACFSTFLFLAVSSMNFLLFLYLHNVFHTRFSHSNFISNSLFLYMTFNDPFFYSLFYIFPFSRTWKLLCELLKTIFLLWPLQTLCFNFFHLLLLSSDNLSALIHTSKPTTSFIERFRKFYQLYTNRELVISEFNAAILNNRAQCLQLCIVPWLMACIRLAATKQTRFTCFSEVRNLISEPRLCLDFERFTDL